VLTSCSFEEPTGSSQTFLVSVNQTDVTGWTGLLAEDQHILDSEVLSLLSSSNYTSGKIAFNINDGFVRSTNSNEVNIWGSTGTSGSGGTVRLFGKDEARNGAIHFSTPNNAENGVVNRLSILGSGGTGTDYADAEWYCVYHKDFYLKNRMKTLSNYIEFTEMTPPGAGSATNARMYAVKGGDNLTDMSVVYQDGTVDIFSQESTPLDSPIFTYPDETIGEVVMRKPHAGLIQFVMRFPNGMEFVLKELEYHDAEKVSNNKGYVKPLPNNWIITTKEERSLLTKSDNITEIK
jgi:hypothetical protein